MLTAYHKILGVDENASLKEIKSAYRMLAKKFHPDLNKNEGAKAVFIRINEAYEYLLHENEHKGRQHSKAFYDYRERIYKEWIKNNQKGARDRARQYASMNFRYYKRSILDESPLTFYGIKLAGCLTTTVIYLIIIFITSIFSSTLAAILGVLILPAVALIMTIGENHLKMDEVIKWFK